MRKIATMLAAILLLVGLAANPAQAATVRQRLADVAVPGYCKMPASHLHNNLTPKKYLPRQGAIVIGSGYGSIAKPLSVHLRKHGTQLLAQYSCTAGGVGWPSVFVLYTRRNKLISSLELAKYAPNNEHAQADSWRRDGHTVVVRWSAYDGAGFGVTHHTSKLVLRHSRLTFG